jgi:hypothetical protein
MVGGLYEGFSRNLEDLNSFRIGGNPEPEVSRRTVLFLMTQQLKLLINDETRTKVSETGHKIAGPGD